ncbi:hypothetical protein ABK040_006589 [Willaertia magna]
MFFTILFIITCILIIILAYHYFFNYDTPIIHFNNKEQFARNLIQKIPILENNSATIVNQNNMDDNKKIHGGYLSKYKYRYPLFFGNYPLLMDAYPTFITKFKTFISKYNNNNNHNNTNELIFNTKFFTDFSEDYEDICLDFLNENDNNENKPVLLIFPGITGSSESYYVQSLIQTVKHKFKIVVYNRPGCHSKTNLKLKKSKFFLNAHKKTIERIIQIVSEIYFNSKILLTGYSAGGVNIAKQLGSKKVKKNRQVIGAFTVSQPFDVNECMNALRKNKLYNRILSNFIMEVFENNIEVMSNLHPTKDVKKIMKECNNLDTIDEYITKTMHDMKDVSIEYYAKRSTYFKHLQRISGEKLLTRVKTFTKDGFENYYKELNSLSTSNNNLNNLNKTAIMVEKRREEEQEEWHCPLFILIAHDDQIISFDANQLSKIVNADGAKYLFIIETKKGAHCTFLEQYSSLLPFLPNINISYQDKVISQALDAIVETYEQFEKNK